MYASTWICTKTSNAAPGTPEVVVKNGPAAYLEELHI